MGNVNWQEIFIGKTNLTFRKTLVTISGIALLFLGVYLSSADVKGEGSINLKTAFAEGVIQTGSLGLLFSFLGFLLLLVTILARGSSKLKVRRHADGVIEIEHHGVFTDEKAK